MIRNYQNVLLQFIHVGRRNKIPNVQKMELYQNIQQITAFATTNPSNDSPLEVKRVQDCLSKVYGEVMDLVDEVTNLGEVSEGDKYK